MGGRGTHRPEELPVTQTLETVKGNSRQKIGKNFWAEKEGPREVVGAREQGSGDVKAEGHSHLLNKATERAIHSETKLLDK